VIVARYLSRAEFFTLPVLLITACVRRVTLLQKPGANSHPSSPPEAAPP
jgi:hypothetical protein